MTQGLFAQQIIVDNTRGVQELIEDNFVFGCVETSNISSPVNGSINGISSFGYFERGTSNFPFENGVVITSGDANSAGNTTNANILNEGNANWGTDVDLENALGITNTLNATTIEFDFISISNQIQFNYILASEEYFGNFPCDYSDGFAFLIRPAASTGPYTNIAVIPGTNIPVNTSTIHDEIPLFCAAENEQFFDGYNLGDTNYNGRTEVLTATTTIVPNVQYNIKLIIADSRDHRYDSAVFIEGNSFNATVDLGSDITTCAENVTLNGDIQNPDATYQWFGNGALLNGETSPILNVDESGSYQIVVSIPLNGSTCEIEDTVEVTLSSEQTAGEVSDYQLCDDSSEDGVEWFNLSTKTNEVISIMPPSNYEISYHYTLAEAQNNTNQILAPIQNTSNPQTIFIRIEDLDSGCLAYTSFDLIVNTLPEINDPNPLEVCDDQDNDGFTEIDLTQSNNEITNGNTDLIVSYHYTQTEANSGINPIASPYINMASTDNLFIRVVDSNTGCVNFTTISVTVNNIPNLNSVEHVLDACDVDLDGFAEFDLTEAETDILNGLTDVSVSYHTSQEDALSGDNPIADPEAFANSSEGTQIIYIRVVDNTTGCPAIATIRLYANYLLDGTGIHDFEICDDESNDGVEAFDLNELEDQIINGISDVTVNFYTTEEDRDNQVDALDKSLPYFNTSNPQTIYMHISNDDCAEVSEIQLIVNPALLLPNVGSIDHCDTDDDQFTTIDLSSYNDIVSGGNADYSVSYFGSETDAENNTNGHPIFYTNVSNPEMFYARVTNPATGCIDIVSMELNILPAPTVTQPSGFLICDDNQDGLYIVDLESKISEIVTNTTNLDFSFHTTSDDAESGTDEIIDPSNFNASTQTIYTRVESTLTNCYSIVSIPVTVNTLPVLSNISDFQICELEDDQQADFIFNLKDAEILNGQTGKDVLYYTSQQNADDRVNAIDKDNAYQNVSSPQTIYVRIENTTDQDCYATNSFTIVVDPLPIFNPPLDWFICDDPSNDGIHVFDLNEKITEINDGSTVPLDVTFYTSLENAQAGANEIALEYTNTQNPQQIYARVENGSNCHTIAEFGLNVIQAPETNESLPLEVCDDDYDGISTFDLTLSEFDVLNSRQDDIVVAYYENEDDLDALTNDITNPESYNNASNPQTVFIRVTNTVSNCYVTVPLDLIVNLPPPVSDVDEVVFCETEDSIIQFTDVTTQLMDDITGISVTYYETQTDAESNQSNLGTAYSYTNSDTTLYVRAQYIETGCFIIDSFNLHINPNPIAHTPQNLETCDDDDDEIAEFDLSLQTSAILNGQSPTQFTVTYHEDAESADIGENVIDEDYIAYNEQVIYVRVENNVTGCYDTTEFLAIVHPLPVIDIEDVVVICLDTLPLPVSADTGNPNDSYSWSTGETTPEIDIDAPGDYSVTITTEFGCTTTKDFEVIESEPATFEVVEVIDFADPNNITITISGVGNYAYILDDGEPQTSNVFEYVSLGYHLITVIDLNGCTEVTKEVVVIDIPKFFTPNEDGYFDTWHITGVETLVGTTVMIFDRYGKQIHFLTHDSEGWDGIYNNRKMPSNDYWFVADVKRGSVEFQVKGHFTLKR